MAFDLEHWQQKVRAWWTEHGPRIKTASIKSTCTLRAAYAKEKDE
jgi:hypothetical protein